MRFPNTIRRHQQLLCQFIPLFQIFNLLSAEIERGGSGAEHGLQAGVRGLSGFETEVAYDFVLDFGGKFAELWRGNVEILWTHFFDEGTEFVFGRQAGVGGCRV